MKRFFTFIFVLMWGASLIAQTQTFTLDDLILPDTGYWNGADTTNYNGGFGNQDLFFINHYTESNWGGYWDGFAFSNWTDTTTEGYTNQWSVYAGEAHSGDIFGIGYVPSDLNTYQLIPITVNFQTPQYPVSIWITNSTYTALAIKNGTSFSEPFSDGDYYYVKILGFKDGNITDSVIHYLADYRNNGHFVQKDWQEVDLTPLGQVDSLKFTVFSTDVGQYGTNTPTYFCFDDLSYSSTEPTIVNTKDIKLTVYPNPATEWIHINSNKKIENSAIYDLNGKLLTSTHKTTINVKNIPAGIYILEVKTDEGVYRAKFVKN